MYSGEEMLNNVCSDGVWCRAQAYSSKPIGDPCLKNKSRSGWWTHS
jgi:hypothetical protein